MGITALGVAYRSVSALLTHKTTNINRNGEVYRFVNGVCSNYYAAVFTCLQWIFFSQSPGVRKRHRILSVLCVEDETVDLYI